MGCGSSAPVNEAGGVKSTTESGSTDPPAATNNAQQKSNTSPPSQPSKSVEPAKSEPDADTKGDITKASSDNSEANKVRFEEQPSVRIMSPKEPKELERVGSGSSVLIEVRLLKFSSGDEYEVSQAFHSCFLVI